MVSFHFPAQVFQSSSLAHLPDSRRGVPSCYVLIVHLHLCSPICSFEVTAMLFSRHTPLHLRVFLFLIFAKSHSFHDTPLFTLVYSVHLLRFIKTSKCQVFPVALSCPPSATSLNSYSESPLFRNLKTVAGLSQGIKDQQNEMTAYGTGVNIYIAICEGINS